MTGARCGNVGVSVATEIGKGSCFLSLGVVRRTVGVDLFTIFSFPSGNYFDTCLSFSLFVSARRSDIKDWES